jgi:hypothetical protein
MKASSLTTIFSLFAERQDRPRLTLDHLVVAARFADAARDAGAEIDEEFAQALHDAVDNKRSPDELEQRLTPLIASNVEALKAQPAFAFEAGAPASA